MSAKDEFSYHEALHTAHVCMELFSEQVSDHPAMKDDAAMQELCDTALTAMMDVYQAIGRVKHDLFKDAPPKEAR